MHSIHSACANAPYGLLDWMAESLADGSSSPIHPFAQDMRGGAIARVQPRTAALCRHREVEGAARRQALAPALGVVVDEHNLAKAQCCFVKTVAIACGEGASVLRDTLANVIITSEMSHEDVLAANARGVVVLLAGHSTMERAYLRHLREELQDEWADSDWNVKVRCSQVDCNPLAVV